MKDLFGEIPQRKLYVRTSNGRFANAEMVRIDKARHDAEMYKRMYFSLLSTTIGLSKALRKKNQMIYQLATTLQADAGKALGVTQEGTAR